MKASFGRHHGQSVTRRPRPCASFHANGSTGIAPTAGFRIGRRVPELTSCAPVTAARGPHADPGRTLRYIPTRLLTGMAGVTLP